MTAKNPTAKTRSFSAGRPQGTTLRPSAQAAARASLPARTDLARHARSLWVGKRIASEGKAFEITYVTTTQNGLEILAKSVATGEARGFFASQILASSIYAV